jgi:hypothetical protein
MRPFLLAIALFFVALSPALAQADITGLWVADFYGNKVECHMEQRGQFLYGVAYVTTKAGERNTYHLAGLIDGNNIRAMHGSGNFFVGSLQNGDKAAGTFFFKDGPSFSIQADRTKQGKTSPGGLEWPPGYPPVN